MKGGRRGGNNKLANYLPTDAKPPATNAADSVDAVVASTRNTAELVADLLKHKAAQAQITLLVQELRVKRDALAESLSGEHTEQSMQAVLSAVEAANDVLEKAEAHLKTQA